MDCLALRHTHNLPSSVTRNGLLFNHAEKVYPHPFDPNLETADRSRGKPPAAVEVIEHTGVSGVFLAFGSRDLVDLAREADGMIELVPQVGDFVARGDPLFRVAPARRPMDPHALRQCVAIGPERTVEQDPRFAFRIVVDIANKALSPAINDPTTAVLALDQLHRLLLYVGRRHLDEGKARDADGNLRLVYGTPNWADYVSLAVSEIRHYGAGSMQVARRLCALLEHLITVLPEARHTPLRQELDLLLTSVQRGFLDEQDRTHPAMSSALAASADCCALSRSLAVSRTPPGCRRRDEPRSAGSAPVDTILAVVNLQSLAATLRGARWPTRSP